MVKLITSESVRADMVSILFERLGVEKEKVIDTATLSDLGADSLNEVEIAMQIEEYYDVEFSYEDISKLGGKTFGEIHAFVCSKVLTL